MIDWRNKDIYGRAFLQETVHNGIDSGSGRERLEYLVPQKEILHLH